jgi:DNA-binding MarR family transcriptional regulator
MTRRSRATAAKQAWKLMFDYFTGTSPQRAEALASRGLTPNDARALWSLKGDEGMPIGALAKTWKCDPSNATFIVDRLVRAGFAKRLESPTDRRVKLVLLTSTGSGAKAELMAAYLSPPRDLAALPVEDLERLVEVLEKLMPDPASSSSAKA